MSDKKKTALEKAYANIQPGSIQLEIARQLGEPINPQLKVPVALSEIADVFEVDPGEKVWRYTGFDSSLDTVLQVDADGDITLVKRTPTGDAELSFTGFNSKLEYVLIDDILAETDNTSVLARRKSSITRAMDKREVYAICTALLNKTGAKLPGVDPHEVSYTSGDDLYDMIIAMKHDVEDYGDNYVLLAGSTVKEKIDTYDKDNAGSFNYNVTLSQKLKELGINVIKMFGTLELTDGGGETQVMNKKKMILVARDSTIAEGKPIKFARRRISPAIAQFMGADVDNAQRALIVDNTPVVNSGTNTLAYGVYGYESVAYTITNPKAIAIADATSVV